MLHKVIGLIFIFLIALPSLAYEDKCYKYHEINKKFKVVQGRVIRLLEKNKRLLESISSPMKKVKVSSNLIILNNKLEAIKIKRQRLLKKGRGCFDEKPEKN